MSDDVSCVILKRHPTWRIAMTRTVIDTATGVGAAGQSPLGERFAHALAAKDLTGLCALFSDPVDFAALTPGRFWQAASPQQVGEIVLGTWFGRDDVTALRSVTSDRVADRESLTYRLGVVSGGAAYLVEQRAYYSVEGTQIAWIRIVCSGFRPERAG